MKSQTQMLTVIPDRIESKIFFIRGKKVMLDRDLAELYGVETRMLNQAVKRNYDRFPIDFMFQLTEIESGAFLRSQIVTLKNRGLKSQTLTSSLRGKHRKYKAFAFTEQGVAMLSSVLNSKRAIQVNIQIIRTFTKLRELIASNKELREKIEKLENKYDQQFKVVFDAIKRLLQTSAKSPQKIGFNVIHKNKKSRWYSHEEAWRE